MFAFWRYTVQIVAFMYWRCLVYIILMFQLQHIILWQLYFTILRYNALRTEKG